MSPSSTLVGGHEFEDGVSFTSENTVSAIEQGVDNTGSDDVSGDIESLAADDTTIVFGPGTYHVADVVTLDGYSNLSLVAPNGATVTLGGADSPSAFKVGATTPLDGFRLEGFEFELTRRAAALIRVTDGLLVRDVSVPTTKTDTIEDGPAGIHCLNIAIESADGTGLVERTKLTGGGEVTGNSSNASEPMGFYVEGTNEGKLTFRDCHVFGYPNNGMYTSTSPGEVNIEGGIYKNCGVECVRIGSESSTVRDARIVNDNVPPDFLGVRGLFIRGGSNMLVEGCDITQDVDGDAAVVVTSETESVTIRDCRIETNASDPSMVISSASSQDGSVIVEGCSFEGAADDSAFPWAIECHRSGTVFRDNNISQTGSGRYGIQIDAPNCRVHGGTYDTGSYCFDVSASDTTIDGPVRASSGVGSVVLLTDCTDISINGIHSDVVDESGTVERVLYNGIGINQGDPNSGGEWNGHGEEGITVYSLSGGCLNVYRDGMWRC